MKGKVEQAVCKNLGYNKFAAFKTKRAVFGPTRTKDYIINDLSCDGSEESISKCHYLKHPTKCNHRDMTIGVSCFIENTLKLYSASPGKIN